MLEGLRFEGLIVGSLSGVPASRRCAALWRLGRISEVTPHLQPTPQAAGRRTQDAGRGRLRQLPNDGCLETTVRWRRKATKL